MKRLVPKVTLLTPDRTTIAKNVRGVSLGLRPVLQRGEILAVAVQVLNRLAEGYRAMITSDSHYLHRSSQSFQHTQVRNSIPDVDDRDKAVRPRTINPNRYITIPSTKGQASYNEHFALEIDFRARCSSYALPQRIPGQPRPDYCRRVCMLIRRVERRIG